MRPRRPAIVGQGAKQGVKRADSDAGQIANTGHPCRSHTDQAVINREIFRIKHKVGPTAPRRVAGHDRAAARKRIVEIRIRLKHTAPQSRDVQRMVICDGTLSKHYRAIDKNPSTASTSSRSMIPTNGTLVENQGEMSIDPAASSLSSRSTISADSTLRDRHLATDR